MNRQEMFAAVLTDLNREDKIDMLPGWLESATSRANLLLRVKDMVFRATIPVTEHIVPLPADFLDFYSLTIRQDATPDFSGWRGPLEYMPPDQFDRGFDIPHPTRPPHSPLYYTMRGGNLELGRWGYPVPFKLDLWYYRKMGVPQAASDTNWLMLHHPHVFKNIMLHFGYNHLQEFDIAGALMQSATAEIQALNDATQALRYGTGPLLSRPARRIGGRRS